MQRETLDYQRELIRFGRDSRCPRLASQGVRKLYIFLH